MSSPCGLVAKRIMRRRKQDRHAGRPRLSVDGGVM
jgi:hypothetical protein